MNLPDSAMPGLFQGADRLSVAAQNRFLFASRARLVLVVVAAAAGVLTVPVPAFDVAALITALALAGAVLAEGWLLRDRPERSWYDGRALAESAKTLTWRYAVGAMPFEDVDDPAAEQRFAHDLAQLLRDAPTAGITPAAGPAISDEVRWLRAAPLAERQASYLRHRIDHQVSWYASRSEWNDRRARGWRIVLLVVEVAGVGVALLRLVEVIDLDLAGIVAALVAAGAAWLATKQHENLARAYAFAATELGLVRTRLVAAGSPLDWAREVADAEEAVSREHTMWRASRSSR